jgi:hypothetical protein
MDGIIPSNPTSSPGEESEESEITQMRFNPEKVARKISENIICHINVEPLDAMKGCKAWAKRAHALYEKQHNNPS